MCISQLHISIRHEGMCSSTMVARTTVFFMWQLALAFKTVVATVTEYSKTFLKGPLKNRQNKVLNDKW